MSSVEGEVVGMDVHGRDDAGTSATILHRYTPLSLTRLFPQSTS